MLDQLETLGRKESERIVWETTLYYYGAMLLNIFGAHKDPDEFNGKSIKFYAIILGDSGSGKTYLVKSMEKIFQLSAFTKLYKTGLRENFHVEDGPSQDSFDDVARYLPMDMRINAEGTQEGLFLTVYAQNMSKFASINLFTDEFGDTFSGSSEMINKLKEMYDGTLAPKIIKGNETTANYGTIEEVVCNFLAMGSSQGFSSNSDKELRKSVESGMYRRTYVVDVGSMKKIIPNEKEEDIERMIEYIDDVKLNHAKFSQKRKQEQNKAKEKIPIPFAFKYEDNFMKRLDEISHILIEDSNNDLTNRFKKYDTAALEMITDLAFIISFLQNQEEATVENLDQAYEFFKRTRTSCANTFKPSPPHKIMYELLNKKNGLTITELSDLDHSIPLKATAIQDAISGLKELCYINSKHLKVSVGAVIRYTIEDLPINKLDKIILSVSQDNKGKNCINYKPTFLEWKDIPRLVKSENFDSFTCCHYSPSGAAKEGHRRQDNFIEEQNLVAFDIDSGMSIKEAEEILKPYKYLIYTTKSHQIDKNDLGEICDRFRILMPTKVKFYVSPDQHKKMYENLEILLGITANDVATRNVSRMFFTNTSTEIFENDGELIDVSSCIPDTIMSNHIIPNLENIAEMESTGEMTKREVGFVKWALTQQGQVGNRNNTLFSYMTFLEDLGSSDIVGKIYGLNSMLQEPLSEKEVDVMLRARHLI